MAIAKSPPVANELTYEQYMAEDEIPRRYDIVDGARTFMPGPKWRHQRIGDNTTELLRRYERATGIGLALSAPFDVLIRRKPLRTRQPDVLFITKAQLEKGGGVPFAA